MNTQSKSLAGLIAVGLMSLAGAATGATTAESCAAGDSLNAVKGGKFCLAVETLKGKTAVDSGGALIVVLHGDGSRGGPTDYHYRIAREAAADHADATAVAILRPGYEDSKGKKSDGRDNGRRDHYTPENIDSVAAVIKSLRDHYRPTRVLLIGHSGGSAFTGVILGRHPGLVDGAVLASCPCDIPRWRQLSGSGSWPNSLSPASFADKVPVTARVVALTGGNDKNTTPSLARNYVESLTRRGVAAEFREIPGATHDMDGALRAATREAIKTLLTALTVAPK